MEQYKNPEIRSFETDALFEVPILDLNIGKPIPTIKVYQEVNQELQKKPYSERFYGYRPLFIPANKDGKFKVSCSPGWGSDEWHVYVGIDLDRPDFQERVCSHIKKLKNADIELGIDQLSKYNIKARPIYDFKILGFNCAGQKFPLQKLDFGTNYFPTTEDKFTISAEIVTQTEKDAQFIVDNADKIKITCEYYLHKVETKTNRLSIYVSDLVKTQVYKDLKGTAQGKFIQRGDVRKLVNTLVSNIIIESRIEQTEIADKAIDNILQHFLNRISQGSDQFAQNAKEFYDQKVFSDNDYQPDVQTFFKSEHIDNYDSNVQVNAEVGVAFGFVNAQASTDITTKINKEDRQEWIGKKYDAKNLVLLSDVLMAFEQNYDISYNNSHLNKITAAEPPYIILFADFDYTPQPEPPKAEEPAPEPPKAEPPPEIIVENHNGINLELIRVEGGTFLMGGQDNEAQENEKPVHEVKVDSFYIGKYPVTQVQYRKIMNNNPSHFRGDNLPVEQVSWDDALEFCHRLSDQTGKTYRLPTEAEWEYAARGGQKTRGYKYAGSNNLDTVAYHTSIGGGTTRSVGSKNANELGLYDMSGNVREWCQDWYDDKYYAISPERNPKGPEMGTKRVLRGGSWDTGPVYCQVAFRHYKTPDSRSYRYGFRVMFVP